MSSYAFIFFITLLNLTIPFLTSLYFLKLTLIQNQPQSQTVTQTDTDTGQYRHRQTHRHKRIQIQLDILHSASVGGPG